ncbi:protein DEHYDRATION-INDUCED 19 homolog 3-like isoform X1 [Tripterygium wilfordii]|uniref:protein DEHYDRATION-INDUCED 19 homolog 3-like isoform X1 n=1 Tax=Tripterygium wilfordii TaxID=458696 RepID=UPI0018F7FB49|nr:protein DEHYDRATION-INDUCED 19 homolog 3-like isoform X1 [Tripterygium wilfordii]
MDADSRSARLSSASKRYQSALQSRSDMYMVFEEIDGDDDVKEEFPCPFCSEYFDIVGLSCHIDDEHPVEAKNGEAVCLQVCPVCAMRVGIDMVAHITLQHGNIFRMQRKRKSRKGEKGGSHSTLSLLRKELREGNLQSLFGGSSCTVSSNAAPDPLLSSFILPVTDNYPSSRPSFIAEASSAKKSSDQNKSEVNVKAAPLSIKDQDEKTKRCEFVQGLLLSTMLHDTLDSKVRRIVCT